MAAQDDYESVSEFAERLGLEDQEKENFISSSMKRLGHRPRVAWEDAEPDGDNGGGGDFFSGKRQQRQQRQVRDERGGRRASGGSFGYE